VSYVDELLTGYRQGLASNSPHSIKDVRAALAEADDPRQRGTLLGLLAKELATHGGNRCTISGTPSEP
jgi:hypothetical protein